jgi:hypothetical protein
MMIVLLFIWYVTGVIGTCARAPASAPAASRSDSGAAAARPRG